MSSNSPAIPAVPVFFDAGTVARHLPWRPLIDALKAAFAAGDVSAPTRSHHRLDGVASGSPMLLTMPAWSAGLGVGTKLVAVYPDNHRHALPSIHGLYVLMEAATGRPQAVLDGGELTSRRTAAASALASQCLSRPDSRTLLMVGTGRLSQYLPLAHAQVRPIERVLVWGRSLDKSQAAARELSAAGLRAEAVESLEAACGEADIISCATLAREPLLRGDWLRPGTHVDLVGAFTPAMCEADGRVFERAAAVYGDTLDGVLAEAGDVIQALASGALSRQRLLGDLAGLCRAAAPPARANTDITVFKSVGAALEDLVAARLCLDLHTTSLKA
ncbi:MAG: ornithine cyclodeaminase family protein [Polaromonas sp.]